LGSRALCCEEGFLRHTSEVAEVASRTRQARRNRVRYECERKTHTCPGNACHRSRLGIPIFWNAQSLPASAGQTCSLRTRGSFRRNDEPVSSTSSLLSEISSVLVADALHRYTRACETYQPGSVAFPGSSRMPAASEVAHAARTAAAIPANALAARCYESGCRGIARRRPAMRAVQAAWIGSMSSFSAISADVNRAGTCGK